MDKMKQSKLLCTLAIMIIVGGYAVERIISIAFNPGKEISLIMAIAYTVLLCVVYFMIYRSKDYYIGMLAALLGYKMMPPNITSLDSTSIDGSMMYFVVRKAAIILFVLLILKFYELQDKPRLIKPVPILSLMVMVPFFTEISDRVGWYLLVQSGSMLYVYFTAFICYALATVAIIVISYRNNFESLKFAVRFEYMALGINLLRRATVVVVNLASHNHVSKSYYVWIALYVGLIAFCALAEKRKAKKIEA